LWIRGEIQFKHAMQKWWIFILGKTVQIAENNGAGCLAAILKMLVEVEDLKMFEFHIKQTLYTGLGWPHLPYTISTLYNLHRADLTYPILNEFGGAERLANILKCLDFQKKKRYTSLGPHGRAQTEESRGHFKGIWISDQKEQLLSSWWIIFLLSSCFELHRQGYTG